MKLASWLKFSMVSVEAYHSSPTADQMLAKISDLVKAGHQTSHPVRVDSGSQYADRDPAASV